MKKIIKLVVFLAVILSLLYLSKYFLKPKKTEFVFDRSEQIEEQSEEQSEEKTEEKFNVKNNLLNWGFKTAEKRGIDTVIVHTSYNALGGAPYDVDGLIKEYEKYKVAPHYLIDRNGQIYLLVEEKNVAYHAGVSRMADGRKDVNEFSIGIEIMNTKIGQMTDEQYEALNWLIKDIKSRQKINYVLGHNDVATNRKDDPWNMDWSRVIF